MFPLEENFTVHRRRPAITCCRNHLSGKFITQYSCFDVLRNIDSRVSSRLTDTLLPNACRSQLIRSARKPKFGVQQDLALVGSQRTYLQFRRIPDYTVRNAHNTSFLAEARMPRAKQRAPDQIIAQVYIDLITQSQRQRLSSPGPSTRLGFERLPQTRSRASVAACRQQ